MGGWDDKLNKEQATKFVIIIDHREDGLSVVECPSIPWCINQGKTEQEALENIEV